MLRLNFKKLIKVLSKMQRRIYMITIKNNSTIVAIVAIVAILVGCSSQDSSEEEEPSTKSDFKANGHDVPLAKYVGSDGENIAIVFDKSATEPLRYTQINYVSEEEFGIHGDEFKGGVGSIVRGNQIVAYSTLPLAVPFVYNRGFQWKIKSRYGELTCNWSDGNASASVEGPFLHKGKCSNDEASFGFVFSPLRGVISFQSFCGDKVCSYRLVDGMGLSSKRFLAFYEIK